jgi:translation initiation factor IF-3
MVLAPHRGAKTRAKALHPDDPRSAPDEHDGDAAGDAAPSPN